MATKEHKTPDPTRLYVVFHGEFAFFDDGDAQNILAVAPAMDIHVYAAGPWLGENRIPRGLSFVLSGVVPGSAQLQPMTLMFYGAMLADNRRYMKIILPRPACIHRGARMHIDPSRIIVGGNGGFDLGAGDTIALALIFEYTVQPEQKHPPGLQVVDGEVMPGYEPNWNAGKGRSAYVLHIFAEADCNPGAMHIKMASTASAALLGIKVDITIDGGKQNEVTSSTPPPGLTDPEVNLTLAQRTVATGKLGELFQKDPDRAHKWPPPGSIDAGGAPACGTSTGLASKPAVP